MHNTMPCLPDSFVNYYWKQINKFRLEWSPILVLGAVWIGLPFLNVIESMYNLYYIISLLFSLLVK